MAQTGERGWRGRAWEMGRTWPLPESGSSSVNVHLVLCLSANHTPVHETHLMGHVALTALMAFSARSGCLRTSACAPKGWAEVRTMTARSCRHTICNDSLEACCTRHSPSLFYGHAESSKGQVTYPRSQTAAGLLGFEPSSACFSLKFISTTN